MKNISFWKIECATLLVVIVSSISLVYQNFFRLSVPEVIFLNVGQGDAMLLKSQNGRKILVDAGKYPNISSSIAKHIPFSDRSIDMLVATHPDLDHIGGFNTLLDEFKVGYFMHSGLLAGSPIYRTIAKKVKRNKITPVTAIAGQKILLDKDLFLEILAPYPQQKIEDSNDHSIVLKISYRGKSILMTGDASKILEQKLVDMYGSRLESDILKIGHHGSKTSTSDEFVETVKPRYGIISAACNNSFGHPHASVLRTIDNYKVQDLSTCDYGDIVFRFQKGNWVLQNKKSH